MRCGRVAALVAAVWRARHIERRGAYSAQRLLQLRAFAAQANYGRIAAVLALTPIPAVILANVIELIPLRDPKDGIQFSLNFWIRTSVFACIAGFTILEHCRLLIVRLPLSMAQMIGSAVVCGVSTSAAVFGLALTVGYPVPFSMVAGSPIFVGTLCVGIIIFCSRFLANNPRELQEFRRFLAVLVIQVVMPYIYDVYALLFDKLTARLQIVAAVLAPLIKCAIKRWVAHVYCMHDDLRPELVVFNAEIYHSLFISWCL